MDSQSLHISEFVRISNFQVHSQKGIVFQKMGASLDAFLQEFYQAISINYPKFYKMDRLSQVGILATEVLLKDRSITIANPPESVGIVLSNKHASIDTDKRYFGTTKTYASPALFVYTLPNIVAGEISIRQKIKGENAFFVSDHFDADWMADYVSIIMENESTNACIAGWVDVADDQADVLLYLVEKISRPNSIYHNAPKLRELYTNRPWNN